MNLKQPHGPRSPHDSKAVGIMMRLSLASLLVFLIAACGEMIPTDPTPGPLAIEEPAEAFIGDETAPITLQGENIAGNATVTVGGESATNVIVRGDEDQLVTGTARNGTSITFTPPVLQEGVHDIVVAQNGESVTLTGFFQYQPVVVDPVGLPLYINAGGPTVDAGGVTWVADTPYLTTPGLTIAGPITIADAGDLEVIYQTERYSAEGGTVDYLIPVDEAGTYDVTLHFAEIFYGQPGNPAAEIGSRVFNVTIQGELRLEDYDLHVVTGGQPATAVTETFSVVVQEGAEAIVIVFSNVADRAKISAIEVHGN